MTDKKRIQIHQPFIDLEHFEQDAHKRMEGMNKTKMQMLQRKFLEKS